MLNGFVEVSKVKRQHQKGKKKRYNKHCCVTWYTTNVEGSTPEIEAGRYRSSHRSVFIYLKLNTTVVPFDNDFVEFIIAEMERSVILSVYRDSRISPADNGRVTPFNVENENNLKQQSNRLVERL